METVVRNDELINIQTNLVEVTIKGAASHPLFPGIEFRDRESTLRVACDDSFDIQLSGDPETLSVQNLGRACLGHYRLRPLFFEQQRYEIIIEPESGNKVEFWHENYNVRKNVTPVGKRGDILTGIINSNFPQGFLMKSLINSDFVSIIMLTYTGLDKTYDLAHYTKRAPAFGIIRSTKIHSYTERSARSYDNPKCKK